MQRQYLFGLVLSCISTCVAAASPASIGVIPQVDAHDPLPWRTLTSAEQSVFDLGYAVFNTQWVPANAPVGRRDGLGPIYNSSGCDTCHNSRRRGRGPAADGEAPADLVMQLGVLTPDGNLRRGTEEYGRVLNTAAIAGFNSEGIVTLRYQEHIETLNDGAQIRLRKPEYLIGELSGPPLSPRTVLMPRETPSAQGAGLLEMISTEELLANEKRQRQSKNGIAGHISWIEVDGHRAPGRFGWQATEPTIANQISAAFSREMGLSTSRANHIDCGREDTACRNAPTGGDPEVEPALFDAVVFFEQLHAVPGLKVVRDTRQGSMLFEKIGCAECHRPVTQVKLADSSRRTIRPYTDLLLHDLGQGLDDRTIEGAAVHGEWRTAPLWGLQASVASSQSLRLLHDGRARSVEEAILWHDGEAHSATEKFKHLSHEQRDALIAWVITL